MEQGLLAVRIKPGGGIEAAPVFFGYPLEPKELAAWAFFHFWQSPLIFSLMRCEKCKQFFLPRRTRDRYIRGWHCTRHVTSAGATAATKATRVKFREFWMKRAVQAYCEYHSQSRRANSDLIGFITNRVKNAIDRSEFKNVGQRFSRNSISRGLVQIRREAEKRIPLPTIEGLV
jgi:hypothetical protein